MWVTSDFILKIPAGSFVVYPTGLDGSEERRWQRAAQTQQKKGVEPGTSGFLEKWHLSEKSESSVGHQPLWTS